MHFPTVLSFGVLALTPLVAGHAAIIKAVGDQGGNGSAIGSMLPQTFLILTTSLTFPS